MGRIACLKPRTAAYDPRRSFPPPKAVDPYYLTPEHRTWRDEVVRRAGGRCQAEGCRKAAPRHRMFADHIVERKDGGDPLDPANGQCLCGSHHSLKTAFEKAKRAKRTAA